MNVTQIEEKIAGFLRDNLGRDVKNHDQDLLKEAIIDSFNMIQLIQFIEETFEISIDIEELDLEAFKSIRSIAGKVVEWKLA